MEEKQVWGDGTPWKNSTAFFTYLRGGLRRVWSKNPMKLEYIKKHRILIKNPSKKGKKAEVFGFVCESCKNEFPLSMGEVDHITPVGQLKEKQDIQGFVEKLLFVTEDDLQLVCKSCHACKSYAEKQGISFEEAKLEKQVIEVCKLPATELKQWLTDAGEEPEKNAIKRKEQVREVLKNGSQD